MGDKFKALSRCSECGGALTHINSGIKVENKSVSLYKCRCCGRLCYIE